MKRFVFILFLIALGTAVYSLGEKEAAPAEEDGVVKLRFTTWTSNESQLALFQSMVEEFNSVQDEYQVDLIIDSLPFTDYVSKITIQLAGSNPPDIGWLVETSAPTFVNAGVLEDLRGPLEKYDYQDFSGDAMELWEKDGSILGVPFSTSPFIIIYNKDIFKKAGVMNPSELQAAGEWTWEKFREVSKKIVDSTGIYAFQGMDGVAYESRVWHTLVPIIRAYGGDAWDKDGNVLINSPEAVKAVTLYHEMIFKDGSVVPPGDLSDFYAGNAAMTVGQISRVSKLKDVTWEWDIAPMPQGPYQDASYTIGQAAVVAFSSGKHKDAAAAFIAFMTDKENVSKMAQYWPPARKSVMNSEEFIMSNNLISSESMITAVVPGLKKGRVLPSHENFPQIELSAAAEFDRLWNKNADIKAVLDSVAQAIASQM